MDRLPNLVQSREIALARWHIRADVTTTSQPMRVSVYLCGNDAKTELDVCVVTSEQDAERAAQKWAADLGIPLEDIEINFS
jgi:ribosomal protein L1